MSIEKTDFFTSSKGEKASLYTVKLGRIGMAMSDFGATLVSLFVPDKNGRQDDILLGCSDPAGWETTDAYFGATVGRYANRIGGAHFTLNGHEYPLRANDGANHLHGGPLGFSRHLWTVETSEGTGQASLRFSISSPDGDEGYPGKLDLTVVYTLSSDGKLDIRYRAQTDAPTVVNFTNHAYFNLHGNGNGLVLNHILELKASKYVEVGPDLIPTGKLVGVTGGPFDFRTAKAVGADIGLIGTGYDHCFVLDRPLEDPRTPQPFHFATLRDPDTGRRMEAYTTCPGVQFYSGNYLNGQGKNGAHYAKHAGLCLETGCYPDSPNQPAFPSCVLNPGQQFSQETAYCFFC